MANDFKWHKVTEKEKEEIRRDSKKLLNEFASKLDKIKSTNKHFENDNGYRDEGDGWITDLDFKDIMFANAPFVDEDHIVAEKGGWK